MSEAQKYIKELLESGKVSAVYCGADDPDMSDYGGGITYERGCAVKMNESGRITAACPLSAITLVLLAP